MSHTLQPSEASLAAFRAAVGEAFVLTNESLLRAFATATFATSQRVFAVVQPASAEEAAACLSAATEHQTPIYPVSRGRNWGLGCRVPTVSAVVLDLSRMSNIAGLDERFGSLVVEPGVTFRQVQEFLTAQQSRWFLPTIGGPPDASVIGNFIERGDGSGPHAERLSNIASLQVVLPTGEIVHTGYERFGNTALSWLSSLPAGPALHGLFTQSNLGIVTRATIYLSHRPTHPQLVSSVIQRDQLSAFLEALQQLQQAIGTEIFFSVWNGAKLNARGTKDSVQEDGWFSYGVLYGQSALIASAWRDLAQQLLAPHASVKIANQEEEPDLLEQISLFVGEANTANLRSLYSGVQREIPAGNADPHRDGCGVLWLCPEVPFHGASVMEVIAICETIYRQHGFEMYLGMSALSPRTLRLFLSVFYDREATGADEKAMQCHDALLQALQARGVYCFRLGLASMHVTNNADDPFWRMLRRIKKTLDPAGILSPGRYE